MFTGTGRTQKHKDETVRVCKESSGRVKIGRSVTGLQILRGEGRTQGPKNRQTGSELADQANIKLVMLNICINAAGLLREWAASEEGNPGEGHELLARPDEEARSEMTGELVTMQNQIKTN